MPCIRGALCRDSQHRHRCHRHRHHCWHPVLGKQCGYPDCWLQLVTGVWLIACVNAVCVAPDAQVLAFVTMLGWTLGTIESVSLTILAGFSVDFVVHLAHSYEASKLPDRCVTLVLLRS